MRKTIIIPVIIALGLLCSCGQSSHDEGISDKTNDINQTLERADNWKCFVTGSSFQIGEPVYKDTWYYDDDEEDGDDYYESTYDTYPLIDGSTACIPMGAEFARQHLGLSDEDVSQFCVFSTTHDAYENLINKYSVDDSMIWSKDIFMEEGHPVDIFLGTEPSDDQLKLAKKKNVELIKEPVCYDAFVFITHKSNPVESLTPEQLRGIYSGKITNWREVGGNDEKIVPYQREKNSGSQTAMENLVMKDVSMAPAKKVEIVEGMGELVEAVAEYKNRSASIGYTYLYYINTLYKNDNIKVLKIDGVSSETENLYDGSYPFTTNYYGVIRSTDKENTGGKFLSWILSDEGQKSIEQAGYIPMKPVKGNS